MGAGFQFTPTLDDSTNAFHKAVALLAGNDDAVIILGPSVSPAAEEWILASALKISNPIVGRRLWRWTPFVEQLCRSEAVENRKGFRILGEAARRALMRQLLENFEKSGALITLPEIWREERLFSHLLQTIEELRLAGMVNQPSIESFRHLLQEQPVDHQDLWALLLAWQAHLDSEESLHDFPSLLMGTSGKNAPKSILLLGLDQPASLEKDLLQRIASRSEVHWFVAGEAAVIAQKTKAMAGGFAGPISFDAIPETPLRTWPRLLLLATPHEEARAVANLVQEAFASGKSVQLVHPSLGDSHWWGEFWRQLGVEQPPARLGQSAIARRLFSLMSPLPFSFVRGVDFVRHHQALLQGSADGERALQELVGKAQEGGFDSPDQWKILWQEARVPNLEEKFWKWVELWPRELSSDSFLGVLEQAADCLSLGDWTKDSDMPSAERELHLVLSLILRHGRSLAPHGKALHNPQQWFQEWKILSSDQALFWENRVPHELQCFPFDSLLPPIEEGTRRIVVGLQTPIFQEFRLFLPESARSTLFEFSLATNRDKEQKRLDWMRSVLWPTGTICLSSQMGPGGKEVELPWMLNAIGLKQEVVPPVPIQPALEWQGAELQVSIPEQHRSKSVSASFLSSFVKCPFQAFARAFLKNGELSLDLGIDIEPMDLGQTLHRSLELFVNNPPLRELPSAEAAIARMRDCFTKAWEEMSPRAITDVPFVRETQKQDWLARLDEVAVKLWGDWQQTPFFNRTLTEFPFRYNESSSGLDVRGRVDRIDFDDERKMFWIRDYKTGGSLISHSDVLVTHQEIQLPVYLNAVEREFPDYQAAGASYFMLKDAKEGPYLARSRFNGTPKKRDKDDPIYFHSKARHLLSDDDYVSCRQKQNDRLKEALAFIAKGQFPVDPFDSSETCNKCEIRPACRIAERDFSGLQEWGSTFPSWDSLSSRISGEKSVTGSTKKADEAQERALNIRGSFAFVEASAGSGKTTLIVLRILREIRDAVANGSTLEQACDRWRAISFTEKAAHELRARLAAMMLPEFGEAGAALGASRVSTIHGFCAELIAQFPAFSGLHPSSSVMDERKARLEFRKCLLGLFRSRDFFSLWSPLGLSRKEVERLVDSYGGKSVTAEVMTHEYLDYFEAKGQKEFSLLLPEGEGEGQRLHLFLKMMKRVEEAWSQWKLERALLDFDDLERGARRVLEHLEARTSFTLPLILVDEFQDTNLLQRELLNRIASENWSNFFVVGDAKQSIYRFRAADVSVFQNLRKEASHRGELVELSSNYRSRREIVDAVNRLMTQIFPAEGAEAALYEARRAHALPARSEGGKFLLWEYEAGESLVKARTEAEANYVVKIVQDQLASGRRPGDIVLILRKIKGNEAYLKALSAAGVPFLLGSSTGFFSQVVVSDGIALLRSLYGVRNEISDLALLRSPWMRVASREWVETEPRMILNKSPWYVRLSKLAPTLSMANLLALAFSHYPRDRNLSLQTEKLVSFVESMESEGMSPSELIDQLSQWSGWENLKDKEDDSAVVIPDPEHSIRVMTVHASKGLEFPVVILAALDSEVTVGSGSFRAVSDVGMALAPLEESKPGAQTSFQKIGQEEKKRERAEWKRLLYVACTRAQEECHIVLPKKPEAQSDTPETADAGTPALWLSKAFGSEFKRSADSLLGAKPNSQSVASKGKPVGGASGGAKKPIPAAPSFLTASVTELASFSFCPEFHRRKFVQGWDDTLVNLWSASPKSRAPGKASDEMLRLNGLLFSLGIERKERGVALHRVLERMGHFSRETARTWLEDSYGELGIDLSRHSAIGEAWNSLIEFDLSALERIYRSPAGELLLDPAVDHESELPFLWEDEGLRVIGSIDRVVHLKNGTIAVVDYKSSLSAEGVDRYRYQVNLYRLALGAKWPVKVVGYLLDLSTAQVQSVEDDFDEFLHKLREHKKGLRHSYTEPDYNWTSREKIGGPHCFRCPYQLHCSVGQRLMIEFR
jgi:ATP-dependent helicase/nuclease subunit A